MNASNTSLKAAVSVSQMCEMCSISRSRWYEMVASGIFPKPIRLPSMKRPAYDRDLQEKCLEIRASGIGMNGVPVLFNRKSKTAGNRKVQRKLVQETKGDHADLLDVLKGLGLTTTAQAVAEAVATLYPNGLAGLDQGDVVRRVFLHLQGTKGGGR
jgi:predicted DNA-binding transcriptional regulator AlpA